MPNDVVTPLTKADDLCHIGGGLAKGDEIAEREGTDAAGDEMKPSKHEALSSSACARPSSSRRRGPSSGRSCGSPGHRFTVSCPTIGTIRQTVSRLLLVKSAAS